MSWRRIKLVFAKSGVRGNILDEELQSLAEYYKGSFFSFPLKRNAYLPMRYAAYNALRTLLDESFGEELCKKIQYPEYGCIALGSGSERRICWVNISYTSDAAMAGISEDRIGVDIQKVRRVPEYMLKSISSEKEYSYFSGRSNREKTQLFSLKESYAKAKGVGMVWPSAYAEFDDDFTLGLSLMQGGVESSLIEVASDKHVASMTLLS